MKKALFCLFLLPMVAIAQQASVKEAFLEKWEHSKEYLIAIVEAMPEEHFSFKPTERQMTFQEQLLHIKGNMEWLSTTYFTQKEYKRETSEKTVSKKILISQLKDSFDSVSTILQQTPETEFLKTVDFFAGAKSKLQILNLLQDHVTHHRGQLIVYLNLNGIEPPPYSGW
ncbi:DinB family protein [Luteirhabdus pelagi]|uniref:DinB family protein n=1 Tax=Luteirhabdus pelagi TaxID=2792783 RepID=UPI00193AAA85|nr:DinB family protein [Luteirhabdus pelagi]